MGLVDFIVDGPGEHKLLKILGENPEAKHFTPHYSYLPLKKYLSPGLILPYSTSSGCYWYKCDFCPERAEGNEYIPISPENVIQDLRDLSKDLKPSLIHLLDNALSPKFLKKIAKTQLEIPWYGFVRFTKELTDLDFCLALKKSGCVMLKLGLESGSQKVLDSMNKGIDRSLAIRVLNTLSKAGISTYIYLLFGTHGENLSRARETLDFVVKYSAEISFLNLAIFNLPLYTGKISKLKTKDFSEGDLSLYTDFKHPDEWGRREVRYFIEKEFKSHTVIKSIINRNPPLFTSNHAPFFVWNSE